MGGGQSTPATSSPGEHSERYEQGVSQSGQVSLSGAAGKVMADGGRFRPSDQEVREKWVRENGDVLTTGSNDLFSQAEVEFVPGEKTQLGVQDSWHELESGGPNEVAASKLSGMQSTPQGIMDSDGTLHEEGSRALQSSGLGDKIARTAEHYDASSVKALGAKINRLRDEHGEFNFHDPEIAEEFTLGEKEMLVNWEVAGSFSHNVDGFTGDSGFMNTTVVSQGDTEGMASALEQQGEVIVQTHNNSAVDRFSESLEQRASNGELSSDVDVDSITEKLHGQQRSTHFVAVERSEGVDPAEQAQKFSPAREGSAVLRNSYTARGDGMSDFSSGEISAVAETIASENVTPSELQDRLSETLGYHSSPHQYSDSITMPSEQVTVMSESKGSSTVEFSVGFTEDGRLHERARGTAQNPDPLSYGMDDLRCVYAETTVTDSGETVVTDVHTGSVDEFNFDEHATNTRREARFEPDGSQIQVVDDADPISNNPDVKKAASARSESGTGLSAPDDVNAAPDSSTVPTVSEIEQGLDKEVFNSESGSDVFVTGRDGESGNTQKQTGDDGEEIVKSAIYEDYNPQDISAGESETHKFLDIPNAGVEVKAYTETAVESKKVSLGSRDPWSDDVADESFSTQSTDWATENCSPKNTRYVVLKYSDEPINPDSMTVEDAKSVVQRQPTVEGTDFFKDGAESARRVQNGESTMSEEMNDSIAGNLHKIEGVVIASGDQISKNSQVDLNVRKEFEVSPRSDSGSGTSSETHGTSLDDF